MNKKQKKLLLRIVAAAVFFIPLFLISEGIVDVEINRWALLALFLVPYLIVGHDILRKAFKGILNRQVFDENFLMAVSTVAAIALGEYSEGVAVMLLYQVGELFQSVAVGRSRSNISALMDIRPDYANIETEDGLEQVDPDDVEVGTIIVVEPGEKVPIDGVVVEGCSSLNTSALTGESRPRDVGEGDEVLSGCVNMSGLLKLRTTKAFEESTASRVLELVENAASRKSKSENFISRFAHWYTPTVCIAALVLAVVPPLFCMITRIGMQHYATLGALWSDWVLRACSFLVISCPCAVVISVPLGFFAAIGGASAEGILVKGSNYLEKLAEVDTIAFDKTGTLTKGNFSVTEICVADAAEKDEMLELAALAEIHSSHPISQSLRDAYLGGSQHAVDEPRRLDPSRVTDVQEIAGHGIIACVDGREVAVGNEKLMRRQGAVKSKADAAASASSAITTDVTVAADTAAGASAGLAAGASSKVGTVVHVAVDGRYCGYILIADEVKPTSREAIDALYRIGVRQTVLMSGDNAAAAKAVQEELGITTVHAQLLPADKVKLVEQYLADNEKKRGALAFVGDGINDAPVLSRADVGIAMGALGSDAAIEAADIVLMDDDLMKLPKAFAIARKCLRIVRQNIAFALTVKFACLLLSMLGLANMWIAILADVGVMIIAVLNAIRCLSVKHL